MSLLDALAAVPPGWPFPFTPIMAALGGFVVVYAAYVLAPTPSDLE
jgi:hypothetical protein